MQLPITAHISSGAEITSTRSVQRRGEGREGGDKSKVHQHRAETLTDREQDCAGSAELREEECKEEVWKLWELTLAGHRLASGLHNE